MAVSIDWYGFRVVSWIGQAIIGLAAIRRGLRGDWKGGIALAGVASASFVFTARQKSLPLLFDLLFPIGALLNAAGWVWKLFRKPGPYDEITHGFTIFSITLALGIRVSSSRLTGLPHHRIRFVAMIASFGLSLGAIWEIFEFWLNKVPGVRVFDPLGDTISDMMIDGLGALLAALLALRLSPDSSGNLRGSPKL